MSDKNNIINENNINYNTSSIINKIEINNIKTNNNFGIKTNNNVNIYGIKNNVDINIIKNNKTTHKKMLDQKVIFLILFLVSFSIIGVFILNSMPAFANHVSNANNNNNYYNNNYQISHFGNNYNKFYDKISSDVLKKIKNISNSPLLKYNSTNINYIIVLNTNNNLTYDLIYSYLHHISKSNIINLTIIHGFSLTMSLNNLYNLLFRYGSSIYKIYLNKKVKVFGGYNNQNDQFPSYGDNLIGVGNLNRKYNNTINGSGIKIAVIDTGIDYNHPYFGSCNLSEVLNHNPKCVVWGGDDLVNSTKVITQIHKEKNLFDNNKKFFKSLSNSSYISFTLPTGINNISKAEVLFYFNITLFKNINYSLNISLYNHTLNLISNKTNITFVHLFSFKEPKENQSTLIKKPKNFIFSKLYLNITAINITNKTNKFSLFVNKKKLFDFSFNCTLNHISSTNITNNKSGSPINLSNISNVTNCTILKTIVLNNNYSSSDFNITINSNDQSKNITLNVSLALASSYKKLLNLTSFVKNIYNNFNNENYYLHNQFFLKYNIIPSLKDSIKSKVTINPLPTDYYKFSNLFINYSYQTYKNVNNFIDYFGHGTHVAGIIHSVAPAAKLYSYRVLNYEGFGYTSTIIKGIEKAIQDNMNIISMSLGEAPTFSNSNCDDNPLSLAIINAYNKGIDVVVAAGNSGHTDDVGVSIPSCSSGALSIGAIAKNKTLAYFSQDGKRLDVVAPGVNINSTVPTYSNLSGIRVFIHNSGGWAKESGTSMATPFVSGSIALLLQAYNKTYGFIPSSSYVYAVVRKSATDLGVYGKDDTYGYGMINVTSLIGFGLNMSRLVPSVNKINIQSYNDSNYTFYLEPMGNNNQLFNFTINWTNLTNKISNSSIKMIINNHNSYFSDSLYNKTYPIVISFKIPFSAQKIFYYGIITIHVLQTNQYIKIPVVYNNMNKSFTYIRNITGYIDVGQNLIFPIYVPKYVFSLTYHLTWENSNETYLGLVLCDSKGNLIKLPLPEIEIYNLNYLFNQNNLFNHNMFLLNQFLYVLNPLLNNAGIFNLNKLSNANILSNLNNFDSDSFDMIMNLFKNKIKMNQYRYLRFSLKKLNKSTKKQPLEINLTSFLNKLKNQKNKNIKSNNNHNTKKHNQKHFYIIR